MYQSETEENQWSKRGKDLGQEKEKKTDIGMRTKTGKGKRSKNRREKRENEDYWRELVGANEAKKVKHKSVNESGNRTENGKATKKEIETKTGRERWVEMGTMIEIGRGSGTSLRRNMEQATASTLEDKT